jgi:eukaryotic-like serine/threonine-protein kinase
MADDNDTLESWKEIASYLKRDVTTVQRWEKREGLPVHRHLHDKSGSVFALRPELDRWRRARTRAPEFAPEPGPAPEVDSEPPAPRRDPPPPLPPAPVVPQPELTVRRAVLFFAGLAGLVLTVGGLRPVTTPEPPMPVAFTVAPIDGTALMPNEAPLISPDGRTLVFVGIGADGISRLFVRLLGEIAMRAMPGTEGARHPFWSPDSRQVAFFADRRLKVLAVSGGEPRAICEAPFGQAGAWGDDGVILFPLSAQGGLYRVRMEGGPVVPVTEPDIAAGDFAHRAPHFLPDGRRFVFLVRSTSPTREGIYVGTLDGGAPRAILRSVSEAWYADEHLLFVQPPALMAIRVDPGTLALEGAPVALSREASNESFSGRGLFSVSANGTVVFSAMRTPVMRLVTLDIEGRRHDTDVVPGVFWDLARAPGGESLALTRLDPGPGTRDIWLVDLATYRSERLTSHIADDAMPVWAPHGRTIAFSTRRLGTYDIFLQAVSAGSDATPLVTGDGDQWVNDWSSDGRLLLYSATTPGNSTRSDLFVFDLAERKATTVVRTRGRDTQGRFSPDGRWIAYSYDERGQPDVVLMPYPPRDEPHVVVSAGGGGYPRWRADGKALYYIDSTGNLVVAPVDLERGVHVGGVQVVARGAFARLGQAISGLGADYAPSRDGRSFLIKEPTEAVAGPITVLVNGIGRRRP